MELSIKDLWKIKEALGVLDSEYTDEAAVELMGRVTEAITRRVEEARNMF